MNLAAIWIADMFSVRYRFIAQMLIVSRRGPSLIADKG